MSIALLSGSIVLLVVVIVLVLIRRNSRGSDIASLRYGDIVHQTLAAAEGAKRRMSLPTREKAPLPTSSVHLPEGTAQAILDELRREDHK